MSYLLSQDIEAIRNRNLAGCAIKVSFEEDCVVLKRKVLKVSYPYK
jgi:hypothetical protein